MKDKLILVESVTGFLHNVEVISKRAKSTKSQEPRFGYWFRGETARHDLPLTPRAIRDGHLQEADYFHLFRQRAGLYLDSVPQKRWIEDDLNWLILMQHFGAPTRLLDWSTNPLIGLFMAVDVEDKDKTEAYVYFLDDCALTLKVLEPPNKEPFENVQGLLEVVLASKANNLVSDPQRKQFAVSRGMLKMDAKVRKLLKRGFPVPFLPDQDFRRIAVQSGCFTIHSAKKSLKWWQSLGVGAFGEMRIAGFSKHKIRQELRSLGITSETVYTSVDKFVEDLKRRIGITPRVHAR